VLPPPQEQPSERADAARNRRKIIEAAARIVADRGTAGLSLDEVAREARLGVGTVYRRFGDRAGLLYGMLNDNEMIFQAAFTGGPPPLGPGAAAIDRIRAFLHALIDHTITHADLLLEAEAGAPAARYRSRPYALYRFHLAMLITSARPGADAQYLADALLAPLSATLIDHQRRERGSTPAAIKSGIDQFLHWAVPTPPV
jgi:AcrR family transcriptional regulator